MKEIWLFVKWQWNRWEFWQKCYIVGAFFFGMGLGLPNPYRTYVMIIPVVMLLVSFGKWWIWDQLIESWNRYKKEKSELFDTIKGP